MEVLFESRSNLSLFTGTLHFVQWQPEIHQEPVLRPDTFVDGGGINGYGSVFNDGGRLRMWYQAIPRDWPGTTDVGSVAYAESDDGYHWTKPQLGLVKHGPGDNNLCDLGLHSPGIFIDLNSDPSRRYRAAGCGREGFMMRPGLRYGYYTAHSSDGYHWELDSPEPQWEGGDVISCIYHPGRKSGQIALKKEVWINRLVRRSIHTARYGDGEYSRHVSALYPDDYDDIAAAQRGHFSSDYYGMGMMPAGKSTVGFIWNFRHDLTYSAETPLGAYGPSDITLAFQENEGERWLHMPGRPNFIGHRDLPWTTEGWIHSTTAPVLVGDEHRLYFCGRNYEHYGLAEPGGKAKPKWEAWLQENGEWSMTFARWPKYRLFGFETPREASFILELTDMQAPFEIRLNCKTRKGGRVFASIEGSETQSATECHDIAGDELAAPLVWKSGAVIYPLENGTVRLRIHLEMAAIYAYEVLPIG